MTVSTMASLCPCRPERPSCNYLFKTCSDPRTINNYSSLAGVSSSVIGSDTADSYVRGLKLENEKFIVRKNRDAFICLGTSIENWKKSGSNTNVKHHHDLHFNIKVES